MKGATLDRLWPMFAVAAFVLVVVPFGLFLGSRLLLPGDGTRVVLDFVHAKVSGLTVRSLTPENDSLRTGDIVIVVEGRPIHAWLEDTLAGQWDSAMSSISVPLKYTVARNLGNVDVPVRLAPCPLVRGILPAWSVFVFLINLLLVSVFVVLWRSELPAAHMFLLVATVLCANGVIFNLGLQISDLVRGWPAALWLWGAIGMDCLLMATMLHFTLVFPRRLPLLITHPAVLTLVYGSPWLIYGAFL